MTPVFPGLLAAALYIGGVALQLAGFGRGRRVPPSGRLAAVALAGAVVHALVVWQLIATPAGFDLGLFHAATLFSLITVVLPLLASRWRPSEPLFLLLLPLAAMTIIAALASGAPDSTYAILPPGLAVHIAVSAIAYAALTLAACQAILLAWQEHRLRSRTALAALQTLPPLQTMEAFLFELIWAGFALLTLAIATGAIFLDDMLEQHVAHHTVLSLTSWAVFAGLLWGRHHLGWRGRTAIRWTLAGFILLMLAYFGSKLVLEFLLSS